MEVKEVCKRCRSTQWYYDNVCKYYRCKNCNYDMCSAHKWFIPCEAEELQYKNGTQFFVGNLEDYGINED